MGAGIEEEVGGERGGGGQELLRYLNSKALSLQS